METSELLQFDSDARLEKVSEDQGIVTDPTLSDETNISIFFRRLAYHFDNSKRRKIAEAVDVGGKHISEICRALEGYAYKALGGAVLMGKDWKERSQPVE